MKKIYLSMLFLMLLTAQAFAGISFFPNPNMMRIGGSDGIGFWNAGYARYSFYANYPNLKDRSNKVNPSVVFEARDYADAVSAGDAGENTVYITPDNNLNVGPGAFTVENGMSNDISDASWPLVGSATRTYNTFQATATDVYFARGITTVTGELYTLSFYAYVEPGGTLTGYTFQHSQSASGNFTALTLTEERKRYSIQVLGRVAGGVVIFGFRDKDNTSNWSKVYIDTINITQSSYALPPIINNTASSVSIPLNYEGVKYQLTPDPIGSVYTGEVVWADLWEPQTLELQTGWSDNGDGTYSCDGTQIGNSSVFKEEVLLGAYVTHKFDYTIISVAAGSVRHVVGNGNGDGLGSWITTPDDYQVTTFSTTSNDNVYLQGDVDFIGTVKINYVKQVSRNMGATDLYDALDGVADGTIVLDDDFSTDTSGDYVANNGVLSYVDNSFLRNTYDSTAGTSLTAGAILTAGIRYDVTFRAKGIRTTAFVSIGDNNDVGQAIQNPVVSTEWQDYHFRITPVGAGMRIYQGDGSANDTLDIDDLLIQEISPAQGKMELDWVPMFDYSVVPNSSVLPVLTTTTEQQFIFMNVNSSGVPVAYLRDGPSPALIADFQWQAIPYNIVCQWGPKADDTLSAEKMVGWDFTSGWLPLQGAKNVTATSWDSDADGKTWMTKASGLTVGQEYKMIVNGTIQGSGNFRCLDEASSVIFSGFGTNTFTATTDGFSLELLNASDDDTITITQLELRATNQPKMQLTVTDGTTTWQSAVTDFDGSFDPGDDLSLGYGNSYWQKFSKIRVYPDPKW